MSAATLKLFPALETGRRWTGFRAHMSAATLKLFPALETGRRWTGFRAHMSAATLKQDTRLWQRRVRYEIPRSHERGHIESSIRA